MELHPHGPEQKLKEFHPVLHLSQIPALFQAIPLPVEVVAPLQLKTAFVFPIQPFSLMFIPCLPQPSHFFHVSDGFLLLFWVFPFVYSEIPICSTPQRVDP